MSIYRHRKHDGTTNVTDSNSTNPNIKSKMEEDELTKKISDTINEHDGKISNIPHNHEFHSWMNKLRSLINRDLSKK